MQYIQKDLNTLVDWSKKCQMNFNLDKCHVLHIGNNNLLANDTMNNVQLTSVHQEKKKKEQKKKEQKSYVFWFKKKKESFKL